MPSSIAVVTAPRSDASDVAVRVAARVPSTRVIIAGASTTSTSATSLRRMASAVASCASLLASAIACCLSCDSSVAERPSASFSSWVSTAEICAFAPAAPWVNPMIDWVTPEIAWVRLSTAADTVGPCCSGGNAWIASSWFCSDFSCRFCLASCFSVEASDFCAVARLLRSADTCSAYASAAACLPSSCRASERRDTSSSASARASMVILVVTGSRMLRSSFTF